MCRYRPLAASKHIDSQVRRHCVTHGIVLLTIGPLAFTGAPPRRRMAGDWRFDRPAVSGMRGGRMEFYARA